ncbi:hypothetical protein DXG01_012638 [Tephrocybe rancida]|nr:hypothetical protein DXG01_012638 [Tephrocybe rancida]
MPLAAGTLSATIDAPYFTTLNDLDTWAAGPTNRKLDGVLKYIARPDEEASKQRGKLLVCHDYKSPRLDGLPQPTDRVPKSSARCKTAFFDCKPSLTSHRIFEGDSEEDCLRLLVGRLPQSINGPAKATAGSASLPLSPHYARLLAELAAQRGFDGYLLNFEVPLQGGVEQSRTLAAWITVLQAELLDKVGSHGETHWYDSVIFTGQLSWQDRLNSKNLPFFLSSSTIFTNYTWPTSYPNTTAEYFLTLDPALTGNTASPQPQTSQKSLNDIYMGVDVWGRGSYGGGGFGAYKAIEVIAPESLGLSVAFFGQGWTWESEEDKPGFTWEGWWDYDRKLWAGPRDGEVVVVPVPKVPKRNGGYKDEDTPAGPFRSVESFFPRSTPPDPVDLPLHTTFSPGVGRAWFVDGVSVHAMPGGWTDIDKQCTIGDMLWPVPAVEWDDGQRESPLPLVVPAFSFEDAWNGGSSMTLDVKCPGSSEEDAVFRCIWVPVQTLSVTPGKTYGASLYYKIDSPAQAAADLGVTVKALPAGSASTFEVQPVPAPDTDSDLPGGWSKLSIQLSVPESQGGSRTQAGAIGLIVAIVAEDATVDLDLKIHLGQLNVYPIPPPGTAVSSPTMLWANFTTPASKDAAGTLLGGVITVSSPDDPISAWTVQPSNAWFPQFMYFNVYGLLYASDGHVGQPEEAVWLGTTGIVGKSNSLEIVPEDLPFWSEVGDGQNKVRFYIQGVTDHGNVLGWEQCVFVDFDMSGLSA